MIDDIKKHGSKVVGIYKLTNNRKAENFRSSEMLDIINGLSNDVDELIIFEPLIKEDDYMGFKVINDIDRFKSKSDLIIANRNDSQLSDVTDKLYCRDIFSEDGEGTI